MAVLPSLLNVFLIATSVTASAASATIAGIRYEQYNSLSSKKIYSCYKNM